MDNIGKYIRELRIKRGFTQKDLAEKLNISFQSVSKWERGESLPDTSILLNLAEILDTTVDLILRAGVISSINKNLLLVENIIKGFESIENVGKYFGKQSTFYTGMIEGINSKMNIDFENYWSNENTKEVLLTEVILQHLINGGSIEIEEVKKYIKIKKMLSIIQEYQEKY